MGKHNSQNIRTSPSYLGSTPGSAGVFLFIILFKAHAELIPSRSSWNLKGADTESV